MFVIFRMTAPAQAVDLPIMNPVAFTHRCAEALQNQAYHILGEMSAHKLARYLRERGAWEIDLHAFGAWRSRRTQVQPMSPLKNQCLQKLTFFSTWPRGVTVSTLDSESSDRGSNPREASCKVMPTCALTCSAHAHLHSHSSKMYKREAAAMKMCQRIAQCGLVV